MTTPTTKAEAVYYREYGRPFGLKIHEREWPSQKARFAMAMIERWGMVSGMMDGEDSAGRAKVRLASVDEVVERAVEASEKAFEAFRSKGWIEDLASVDEIGDILKEQEDKRENR